MSDNSQTNTGQISSCLQQKIDKTRYLVEVHFSYTSNQSVEDKLKHVILHDLEHGKQGRTGKSGLLFTVNLKLSTPNWSDGCACWCAFWSGGIVQ